MQKMLLKKIKKTTKNRRKMHTKIFNIKHTKNAPKKYKKMQKTRGLGRRIHGSVEDTKLSTNKQHSLTHRNCKNHTKNAKNDISGITDILPGFSPCWLSPITSFHHIGDNRYYRDILESVTGLNPHLRFFVIFLFYFILNFLKFF
jgi:hypothetical protein